MRLHTLLLIPILLSAGNLEQLVQQSFTAEPIKASQASLNETKVTQEAIVDRYLPHLSVGGNLNYNNEESFGNPQKSNTLYTQATAILYDGGKKWAYEDQYQELVKSKTLTLQSDKNQQALQTIQAYYTVLNIQEQQQAKQQEHQQLKAEIDRFELFYQAGTITLDQVEKIRAAQASNEATLAELELSLQKAQLNLEWLVGSHSSVESGSKLLEPTLDIEPNRTDIASLQSQVKAQKENIDISAADGLPQVQLEGTYSHNEYNYDNAGYDPNFPQDQTSLKISANWKVFDFGMTERRKEASHYQYIAAKEQLNAQERLAKLEFANAKKALQIAQANIRAAEARVNSTEKTYELIHQKFRASIVDNIAYLDALTDKYDAQANLQIAYNNYEVDKANYYYQAGIPLEEKIQ